MKAEGLTKIYGVGCPACRESTGPGYETNICGRCGSVVACGDISFELYPDEVLGIVGESGSGKSTLVKLLYFDSEATHGAIYINEFAGSVLSLSPFQKRQIRNSRMGMVYQSPHLGLRMEVSSGGNISERLITAGWRNISAMRERASYLLQKTEIPVIRMDEPPVNFSGGSSKGSRFRRPCRTIH